MQNRHLLDTILEQIASGKIARSAAAEILGISERQVNRLMNAHGIERPRGEVSALRRERHEASEERKAGLRGLAQLVVDGKLHPVIAARQGNCSVRAIYRWVSAVKNERKTSD